jgi:hypothetical protein
VRRFILTFSQLFFVSRVTFESPGECELAQLVANHLIGDVDRYVLLAVMHSDRQTDELGQDHERRDQVLIGFVSLLVTALSALATK